jgi:molybdate transport system substrate-binding protein
MAHAAGTARPTRRVSLSKIIVTSAALLLSQESAAAELKVITSGGFSSAYEQLLPEFEQSTGIKVTTGSGASQGDGPQTIGAQLARGVPADVVVLSREGLNGLIAAKRISAGTDVDLARTPTGVAVRAHAPKPDLGSVEAVKLALLHAKLVVIPGSTSGIWATTELFPRLGIAGKINVKVIARGTEMAAMVANGDADIAILPVSEILNAKGIDFAGAFPAEIQFVQTFSAAVAASSDDIPSAKKLIAFLASVRAYDAIRKSGLEPVTSK